MLVTELSFHGIKHTNRKLIDHLKDENIWCLIGLTEVDLFKI